MSEDQLSLLDDEEMVTTILFCRRHRYALYQSFIEVENSKTKKKEMKCRYCEEVRLEKKKIAAMNWYNHKKFVTDFYVKKMLAKETKSSLKNDIPQEIMEAKRATLQLKNLVVDLQKPLLVCRKHGKLFINDVNRSEVTKTGRQRYKCKACQKDMHQRHYQANKAIIMIKQQQFRKANPEIVAAQRKRYHQRESYRTLRAIQEKVWVRNLATHYIKKVVAKKNRGNILYSEVTEEMVELERATRLLKRAIKLKLSGEKQ